MIKFLSKGFKYTFQFRKPNSIWCLGLSDTLHRVGALRRHGYDVKFLNVEQSVTPDTYYCLEVARRGE